MSRYTAPSGVAGARRAVEALVGLVYGGTFADVHEDIRAALLDDVFDHREGLTEHEACALSYERVRSLRKRLDVPGDIASDPLRLFALMEWTCLLDTTAHSLLSIHYGLALGTLHARRSGRSDLDDHIEELASMASMGVYLATELGYGNNVAALETEAVYDSVADEFVLHTPSARARKFMPNAVHRDGVPKLGVVLARLKTCGTDEGVFPFVVRLSDRAGPCPGVHVTPLPHKPGLSLDNAITAFDHVRIPRRNALFDPTTHLSPDGVLHCPLRSHRSRFLHAVGAVATGRVGLTAALVACARASLAITLGYSFQRHSFAPGRIDVPVIEHRVHQRVLFPALAATYAMTSLVNEVKRCFAAAGPCAGTELEDLLAVTKAVASWSAAETIHLCRERCGAQGMFAVNRIADYVGVTQGVVTTEGDNLVILSKAAGNLLGARAVDTAHTAPPGADDRDLYDPRTLLGLLGFREETLRQETREDYGRRILAATDRLTAWNEVSTPALAMAGTRGARLALGQLLTDTDAVTDSHARHALTLLATLYGLSEISRESGWYLAHRALAPGDVLRIPRMIDELCARTLPYARLLTDGFALPNSVLRTAIADDYLGHYSATG
ncbi:acyl-CoA dehydrogenase family protein [Streptomyces alanosinicus]|uniref:Acyl-CoA oxidase n=1 Tax=Streptomyces alanosinicus TaxID=68171 RepID=A0A918YTX4_9ACTN|nr:acyl-CoA dehydrogenase [Streptomyces alanosinicus]GHE15889.1 acyl-CoA oxidase [Streptomyces alanosinicus]